MLSFLMQNGYHGNLNTDMNKAFTSRMFCDTTIAMNNKRIPAHLGNYLHLRYSYSSSSRSESARTLSTSHTKLHDRCN